MKFTRLLQTVVIIGNLVVLIPAQALPYLQLDIEGGLYDTTTETIITHANSFRVNAYADITKVSDTATLEGDHFLSIAITPQQPQLPQPIFGSFSVDGITYDIDDLAWGIPPLEADPHKDPGDLSKHSIYETYYLELGFTFDTSITTNSYNAQDNPGSTPIAGSGNQEMLFVSFDIDATSLLSDFGLHFDLYNVHQKNKTDPDDIDINDFAPYSHDAEFVRAEVSESSIMLLMMLGLVGLSLRKFRAHQDAAS